MSDGPVEFLRERVQGSGYYTLDEAVEDLERHFPNALTQRPDGPHPQQHILNAVAGGSIVWDPEGQLWTVEYYPLDSLPDDLTVAEERLRLDAVRLERELAEKEGDRGLARLLHPQQPTVRDDTDVRRLREQLSACREALYEVHRLSAMQGDLRAAVARQTELMSLADTLEREETGTGATDRERYAVLARLALVRQDMERAQRRADGLRRALGRFAEDG